MLVAHGQVHYRLGDRYTIHVYKGFSKNATHKFSFLRRNKIPVHFKAKYYSDQIVSEYTRTKEVLTHRYGNKLIREKSMTDGIRRETTKLVGIVQKTPDIYTSTGCDES